jgi:hypothetical protein
MKLMCKLGIHKWVYPERHVRACELCKRHYWQSKYSQYAWRYYGTKEIEFSVKPFREPMIVPRFPIL